MAKYRKKPVTIEAIQFFKSEEILQKIYEMAPRRFEDGVQPYQEWEGDNKWYIEIPTLEGVMRAYEGDYIIKGVKGEVYPCKPDIFEQTYELAE